MSDFDGLMLQGELARYRHGLQLEAVRLGAEQKSRSMDIMLEGMAAQYENMGNPAMQGIFDRKRITESATIHAVRDVVFNIFEGALLIDESAKEFYGETIRKVFNSKFDSVLKEASINTLKEFQTHIKSAHGILNSVLESSIPFVENSASMYTQLLESHYNDTSLSKVVLETYGVITEATSTPDQKTNSVKKLGSAIINKLHNMDGNKEITIGEEVKRLVITSVKAGSVAVSLLAINSFLSTIETAVGKKQQAEFFPKYIKQLNGIKSELSSSIKGSPDSADAAKVQKVIKRIEGLIEQLVSKTHSSKVIKESTLTEFLHESQQLLFEGDASAVSVICAKMKQKLQDAVDYFNPYKGLETLKVVNIMLADSTMAGIATLIPFIGPIIFLIIRMLRIKAITPAMANDTIKEAEMFLKTLEAQARAFHKAGNTSAGKKVERQYKRLEHIIYEYKADTRTVRIKGFREASEEMPLEAMVESAIEMAQYVTFYETTSDELSAMLKIVIENAGLDELDGQSLLLSSVHCEYCGQNVAGGATMHDCARVESAMYEQITSSKPGLIPESAHIRLQEGQYPSEADFLDDEENSLVDAIAKLNGKDKAIDVIKNKVVSVIEAEEVRTKKRDDDEQAILNKMSPEEVTDLKTNMQESGSTLHIGTSRMNMPETLFEAIVMNRSKNYIREAVTSGEKLDIAANKDTILYESIVLYTIHETFNTLGLETYNTDKLHTVMNDYYYAK
jgi:hypothetical protein